jgi:LacI family transcriptional regulator
MERRDGVLRALSENGIPARAEFMMGYVGTENRDMENGDARNAGYVYTKMLLELPESPTAIIATNDFYAIGAYEAISEHGFKVGKDIAVSGFDDISIAKFMMPPLTTVRCDTRSMANLAIDILMRKIYGDGEKENDSESERNFTLPSEIMLRESTAFSLIP